MNVIVKKEIDYCRPLNTKKRINSLLTILSLREVKFTNQLYNDIVRNIYGKELQSNLYKKMSNEVKKPLTIEGEKFSYRTENQIERIYKKNKREDGSISLSWERIEFLKKKTDPSLHPYIENSLIQNGVLKDENDINRYRKIKQYTFRTEAQIERVLRGKDGTIRKMPRKKADAMREKTVPELRAFIDQYIGDVEPQEKINERIKILRKQVRCSKIDKEQRDHITPSKNNWVRIIYTRM